MTEKILGIDVGVDALAAVMLKRSFKGFSVLETCRVTPGDMEQPFHVCSGEQTEESSFFEGALDVLKEKMNMEGCSASSLSISPRLCSFRNICLPFRSGNKIRQILDFELAVHLPLNHVDYISDFSMPGRFQKQDEEGRKSIKKNKIHNYRDKKIIPLNKTIHKNNLLTISIPVDVVDGFFTPLETRGIKPVFITAGGYAAAEYLLEREKDVNNVLFLDFVDGCAVICVICNRRVVSVRSLQKQTDAKLLVRSIHQTLLGFTLRYDVDFIPEICFVASLDQENDSFENEFEQEITKLISCSVVFIKLTDYIDMPSAPDDFQPVNNSFVNAVAAAVLCVKSPPVINLCRGVYARDTFLYKYRRYLTVSAMFFLFATVSLFFTILADIAVLEKKVDALNTAATDIYRQTFPGSATIVDPLMQMKINVREIEKQVLSSSGNADTPISGFSAIDILRALSSCIPDDIDIEITRLLLGNGRLVISGATDNFNNVDRIKTEIESSDLFHQVRITSARADKNTTRVRFDFTVDFP